MFWTVEKAYSGVSIVVLATDLSIDLSTLSAHNAKKVFRGAVNNFT